MTVESMTVESNTPEKASILIVDDTPRNIHLLGDILQADGAYAIAAATGGKEALQLARRNRPDLILLDVKMPGMDGFAVCRALKSDPETAPIPVIFLTAHKTDAEDVAAGFAVGGSDYVTKPFNERELLARIQTQLRLKFSREAYRALVDYSQQGMMILQEDRCRFANPKMADFTGYPVETLVGMTPEELSRIIHPEDRPAAWAYYQKRLTGQAAPAHYALRLVREDRGVLWVNALSVAMKFHGRPSIQVTLTDATRLRDLEELLGRRTAYRGMIGGSRPMQRVYTLIEQLADIDLPVLLTGETGTGKELAAEALHAAGPRRDRPMLRVNCAAFPEGLIEAELFGYQKGAFTGAETDKPGLFERADGGTLFLDEIGELALNLQAKLLRAIEYGEFHPLGAAKPRRVDARIVAATNADLREQSAAGRFRRDLYFRLRGGAIHLPPLREREGDVPMLFRHFLETSRRQSDRPTPRPTDSLERALTQWTWPGNVRELKNAAEFAGSVCPGPVLDFSMLPEGFLEPGPAPAGPDFSEADEKTTLLRALEKNQWHKSRTAQELGIARSTLYRKMAEYGISGAGK